MQKGLPTETGSHIHMVNGREERKDVTANLHSFLEKSSDDLYIFFITNGNNFNNIHQGAHASILLLNYK